VKGYPATPPEVSREITTTSRKPVVPMAEDTNKDICSLCNYTVFAEASTPPVSWILWDNQMSSPHNFSCHNCGKNLITIIQQERRDARIWRI